MQIQREAQSVFVVGFFFQMRLDHITSRQQLLCVGDQHERATSKAKTHHCQGYYCIAGTGSRAIRRRRITGAEEARASSTETQSAKMIEIAILPPFYQGCKKKKRKINDHFHRLQ